MCVQAKKLVVEGMWLETKQLTVCLDGRVKGVVLPPPLRELPTVTLAYTEEIYIGRTGIRATLSFEDAEEETFVPWDAVYRVASDVGHMMFIDSVPLNDILEQQPEAEVPVVLPPARERPAWLTLVP